MDIRVRLVGISNGFVQVPPMTDDDVTVWIHGLANHEEAAAQKIWERYYAQLLSLARLKLGGNRRVADEEDAVLSAFNSPCQGLQAGRLPRLNDRHDLWRILLALTAGKAGQYVRRRRATKRGGGDVRGESVFACGAEEGSGGIGAVLGHEPTPELAALMADECEKLLAALQDDVQRQIALLKLEGYLAAAQYRTQPRDPLLPWRSAMMIGGWPSVRKREAFICSLWKPRIAVAS